MASEVYLGKPLSFIPDRPLFEKIKKEANDITREFLKNIGAQIAPGTRICLAVPAWRLSHGFAHLSLLDDLEKLGYTRSEFSHAKKTDLIYHREDQIVGREIVVLIKK